MTEIFCFIYINLEVFLVPVLVYKIILALSQLIGGHRMKKKILAVVIILNVLFSVTLVYSVTNFQSIDVLFNNIKIQVNGKDVNQDNILYEGTTYVPLRAVAELLGKEVTWDENTRTAGINDKAGQDEGSSVGVPVDYEIITTQLAEFIGEAPHKNGNKWYKVETKYTEVYFFNTAATMEWVVEDIDNQFAYILDFRGLEWDGYKLPIYFYGEDTKLTGDSGYYGSNYRHDTKIISMSADYDYDEINYMSENGQNISFKEDPRHTLVHEISHHLNNPRIETTSMWLEEGLAYYLSYNYDFKVVDESKYPDYSDRKFIDLVFSESDSYSIDAWVNYIKRDIPNYSKEGISTILDFNGIARSHYGMVEEDTPDARYVEPLIIEYLVDTYGQSKLVELYEELHAYSGGNKLDVTSYVEAVFSKKLSVLEEEFREYIGLEAYYID